MLGVAFSQTSIYEDLFYRLGPAMSFSEPSAESEALVIYNGELKVHMIIRRIEKEF